jgi:benzoate/toluate 1,2-dioxygenase reductase subunit
MQKRRGQVRSIREIANGVLAIDIVSVEPRELGFLPGQFVSIEVSPDKRRSFSISSLPTRRDGFDLLVKPGSKGATATYLSALRIGDDVHFFGPMGYFLYDAGIASDVIFAATGVGISAIWSMILAATEDPHPQRLRLFWGNRHQNDLFFQEELSALAKKDPRFVHEICLSSTGDGHITPHVGATAGDAGSPIYYLCGNSAMISTLTTALEEAGVPAERIRTEAFFG